MTTLSTERRIRDRVPMQKMRKGTHSCSECRRRKVKCISIAGQDRCKECHFRGSDCVEQFSNNGSASSQRTKSMRERISELESLVQTLAAGQVVESASQPQAYIDDVEYSTPISAANSPEVNLPPLMRLFDNHVISPANCQATVDVNSHPGGPATPYSLVEPMKDGVCSEETLRKAGKQSWTDPKTSKDEHTRKSLLKCIDFGEGLDNVLQKNEQQWIVWRSHILANPPNETFADWGKRIIRDGSPSDLGTLVLLLSIGSDQPNSKNLIPLVATLITSDDDYTTTLSGIECSLLLSYYHCSIGQPRRAWLAIQRGLASTQLLGLQRHCSSPIGSGMMLQLHYENQHLSLMLGVSRSIDFYCNIDYPKEDIRFFKSALCAICNKYFIGTRDQVEPSLSLILELDQQIQALVLAIPTKWKELGPDIDQDMILIQIHLQQLRTYLYLPLMLGSSADLTLSAPMYEMSRITCLQSSRELLVLYQFLSQQSWFQNALVDFTGFSAAMLIILNLLGYPKFQMEHEDIIRAPGRDEEDWKIVETTISTLADREKSHDSKVIRQSLKVLRTLSGIRESDCTIYPGCRYRFIVPFFGEIIAQPGGKFGFINPPDNMPIPSQAKTAHQGESSRDMNPESVLGNTASGGSNLLHARSPITISEFSGWHASRTMPERSEDAFSRFLQYSENEKNKRILDEMPGLDFGLGMQPMRYFQQWPYVSEMELDQDWLLLAEPNINDLYAGT